MFEVRKILQEQVLEDTFSLLFTNIHNGLNYVSQHVLLKKKLQKHTHTHTIQQNKTQHNKTKQNSVLSEVELFELSVELLM